MEGDCAEGDSDPVKGVDFGIMKPYEELLLVSLEEIGGLLGGGDGITEAACRRERLIRPSILETKKLPCGMVVEAERSMLPHAGKCKDSRRRRA